MHSLNCLPPSNHSSSLPYLSSLFLSPSAKSRNFGTVSSSHLTSGPNASGWEVLSVTNDLTNNSDREKNKVPVATCLSACLCLSFSPCICLSLPYASSPSCQGERDICDHQSYLPIFTISRHFISETPLHLMSD